MKKASIVLLFCLFLFLSFTAKAQTSCTYTVLTPQETLFFTASGGARNFTIGISPNTPACAAWQFRSSAPWITGGHDPFDTTVGVFVAINYGAARTGTITIGSGTGSATITVIQEENNCQYSLNPASLNVTAEAGLITVNIDTSLACSWDVISNASWVGFIGGLRTGNGQITLFIDSNTNAARTGTVIIAGKTFTINQAGLVCTYSINPTNIQAGASGGDAGFNITTQTGCQWTAQSNDNWIAVLTPSGSGAGRVNYSLQPNTGSERTGSITVGGQTFTITQTSGCSYSVSNLLPRFPASGGSGSFTLTASNGNCSWSVIASEQWIAFTGSTSGVGNAAVTITVAANNGSARSGTIVAANYLLLVSQDGASQSAEFITGSGRVMSRDNKPVRGALVLFTNSTTGETLTTTTNQFGYFHLTLQRGQAYSVALSHKRYKFSGTRGVTYNSSALIVIFQADPEQ